jgi:HipA-like protein
MRKAAVFRNGELAGIIMEDDRRQYVFTYTEDWFSNPLKPAISLTLPKTQKEFSSEILFPFFFNMLSEGVNRKLQNRALRIDEKDHFGLLLATAKEDTIGAITVKSIEDEFTAN